MRRSLVPRRMCAILAASTLSALACSKGDSRADTTTVPASGRATPLATPAASGAPATTQNLPGTLAKPVSAYTGDELYAFTHALAFGGGVEKARKCKNDAGCDTRPAKKMTKVRVDAVDGQDSLDVNAVPANGVIAVRAKNNGDFEEARYGMRADKQIEYYLIVLPGAGGGDAKWQLEELDTTPNARRHTQIGAGVLKGCKHDYHPGRSNHANFYTCESSPRADSIQKSSLVLQGESSDPMWMYCKLGCCIAQQ